MKDIYTKQRMAKLQAWRILLPKQFTLSNKYKIN